MTKYENTGGTHTTATGTDIKRGEFFNDPDPDLCKKFPGKFKNHGAAVPTTQVPVEAGKAPPPPASPAPNTPENAPDAPEGGGSSGEGGQTPPDATTDGENGTTASERPGEDVTDEFDGAEGGKLQVRKVPKGWNVYHGNDEEPLHEKPMLRREVDPFIADYLSEDD